MNRMHGSKGEIKADPTGVGGPTAVVVGSMNAWTLNMARDKTDVTAFQDVNKVYVQGLPDIKGTLGGWFDSDELTIFDIALGDIACFLELVPSTLITPTPIMWSGKAWLDASLDVKATGAVSVSGNFVAADAWSRTGGTTLLTRGPAPDAAPRAAA
jgi:hypothetical protein